MSHTPANATRSRIQRLKADGLSHAAAVARHRRAAAAHQRRAQWASHAYPVPPQPGTDEADQWAARFAAGMWDLGPKIDAPGHVSIAIGQPGVTIVTGTDMTAMVGVVRALADRAAHLPCQMLHWMGGARVTGHRGGPGWRSDGDEITIALSGHDDHNTGPNLILIEDASPWMPDFACSEDEEDHMFAAASSVSAILPAVHLIVVCPTGMLSGLRRDWFTNATVVHIGPGAGPAADLRLGQAILVRPDGESAPFAPAVAPGITTR